MNEEIIIPISLFAFIFAAFYVYITARNKERMSLIEKGANAELFKSKRTPVSTRFLTLKFGLFFVGVAIGVLFGNILDLYTGLEEGVAYVSGIFLFGGLGLLAGYFYQEKKVNK